MSSEFSIIILSIKIAFTSMLVTVPLAFLFAWLLSRKQFKGKFILDVLVSLPIAVPPVVIGYLLLWGLGKNSWLGLLSEIAFGSTCQNIYKNHVAIGISWGIGGCTSGIREISCGIWCDYCRSR